MGDEFTEHDLDTPSEADLDLAYGSKFLSSSDVGDRKIRTKIMKVRKEEMRSGNDGAKRMKFIIFLDGLDKAMVLNATNTNALVSGLGRTPANWIGASIGLYVDPGIMYAGKRVKGLRLRVLQAAAAAAKPRPAVASAAKPAAAPPAPEIGDPGPGFDPDLNDAVPDFGIGA